MNLEQLNAMTDLELDEAVALATGIEPLSDEVKAILESGFSSVKDEGYHPTANTTAGKAQAFDLVVKYELDVSTNNGELTRVCVWKDFNIISDVFNTNVQRAICEAVILSAQEK